MQVSNIIRSKNWLTVVQNVIYEGISDLTALCALGSVPMSLQNQLELLSIYYTGLTARLQKSILLSSSYISWLNISPDSLVKI